MQAVITIMETIMTIKEIEKSSLKLKSIEKIHLVEKILSSLDKPDPEIEKAWAKEAAARFTAYEKGELKTIPFETAIKRIKRK